MNCLVEENKNETLSDNVHATVFALMVMTAVNFSIFPFNSTGFATTEVYNSGYNHGCDDAGIVDQSDRYINQPGKGPSFHTNAFMDGYNDGFAACSARGINPNDNCSDNYLGNGNVTLGAEWQMRALNDGELFQQLSEHQCLFFNSCLNLGGSIPGCYADARVINCGIENGKSYYCPGALMSGAERR